MNKVECIFWSATDRIAVGMCSYFNRNVSESYCGSCKARTTEKGRVAKTVSLLQYEEVIKRTSEVNPICDKCEYFGGRISLTGDEFLGIVKCSKCQCVMKMLSLFNPCPIGKFK